MPWMSAAGLAGHEAATINICTCTRS